MDNLFPPAIVQYDTVAVDQLKFELESAIEAGDQACRQGAERYREAGLALLKIKEVIPHGHFQAWLNKNVDKTYRQVQRWMRLAKCDVNVAFEETWAIINGNRDEDIEAEEKEEKPKNPDWCDRCNRIGSQIKGCSPCRQVAEANRKKAKKKPKPSGQQRPASARPAPGEVEAGPEIPEGDDPSAPETDEDPVAKTMSWAESRLKSVIETLRKTRVVRRDEAEEVLSCVQDALERIWRLSDVQTRAPFRKPCRKCKQEVLLAVTQNNKWMVLNAEPDFGGQFEIMNNVAVAVQRDGKTKLYKSHFSSCYTSNGPAFGE